MIFDPFGDFETQGYSRNLAKEKDLEIVRHPERAAFLTSIDAALERLANIKQLSYSDLKARYEQQKLKRKGGV